MTIKIITDSTADLPQALAEELGIPYYLRTCNLETRPIVTA